MASVARTWCDEADGAVQVLAIIPTGEGFHPSLGICFCGKALCRPVRSIFAGSEQSLREWVVVADPGAAVGRGDAELLHRGFHRGTFHPLPGSACPCMHERGAAIVGVQNKRLHKASLGQHRLPDQGGRQVCTFALMHLPANNLAAEDVDDQIELEEHACHRPGHPGYVPGPDLAGRTGPIAGGRFAPNWRLGPTPMMLLPMRA